MTIGAMLGDMARSLIQRPITQRYPFEHRPTPPRLRSRLSWVPQGCTGCALCVKDCPSKAIELITIDKAKKRFVVRYHLDRCTYCGQCVQNCRFDCLQMASDQWELAALSKQPFTIYYGDMSDIAAVQEKPVAVEAMA